MSGPGQGGKDSGKEEQNASTRANIQGIIKPAIHPLACQGGAKRISRLIRGVLKLFFEKIIRDAVTYTEHAKRKTVIVSLLTQ
ncbi:histone H4 family protein [Opisthorchis viverrini]|uniref:Histone H4 family protein n=1 Tax=Opisthorchis viverrini TaxID=6198 RepID=A0A1S8XAL3_OPIVI|nr:histone H4 family protein [Opisthorchis viverrini]